jgi:hypothetical protein
MEKKNFNEVDDAGIQAACGVISSNGRNIMHQYGGKTDEKK